MIAPDQLLKKYLKGIYKAERLAIASDNKKDLPEIRKQIIIYKSIIHVIKIILYTNSHPRLMESRLIKSFFQVTREYKKVSATFWKDDVTGFGKWMHKNYYHAKKH